MPDTLADRLRSLRRRRLVSRPMRQADLAAAAGLSLSHIKKLESGHRGERPEMETLRRLARALGCRVEELTGE